MTSRKMRKRTTRDLIELKDTASLEPSAAVIPLRPGNSGSESSIAATIPICAVRLVRGAGKKAALGLVGALGRVQRSEELAHFGAAGDTRRSGTVGSFCVYVRPR